MKRATRIIAATGLLILFPYFNAIELRAENDVSNDVSQEAEEMKGGTGKVIAFSTTDMTGQIIDEATGNIYEFSTKTQGYYCSLGDRVRYTFDPAQSGKVIIRAVTR